MANPSKDVPLALDIADLSESAGILAVNEYYLAHHAMDSTSPNGNGRYELIHKVVIAAWILERES